LEKENKDRNKNIKIISGILKIFEIIEINKAILEKALLANINDYEDAVIVESAKEKNVDYIITKNKGTAHNEVREKPWTNKP
jgi:predicted nucleic acid-binding protein